MAKVVDGDTIYLYRLKTVYCFAPRNFKSKADYREYRRLVRYVKKVYPYAKIAGKIFLEYSDSLENIDSKKDKRRLMKKLEKQLQDQFGDELKKLTITQGRILIKLIDRETGNTSYEVIKEFRGGFRAFFWQQFALIVGSSLKAGFDPENDKNDRLIEDIIIAIEHGYL